MCLNTYKQGNELAQNSRDKECDRFSFIEPNSKSRREKKIQNLTDVKDVRLQPDQNVFLTVDGKETAFLDRPQDFLKI